MALSELIEHAESVFLDTAPIIYYIEAHPVYGSLVKQLVRAFSDGRITAYSSVITLAEVLPAPLRAGNETPAIMFSDFLKHGKNFSMVTISAEIAERAARLRAEHPALKAFDAMQIGAALDVKAKLFITNDKKLKNIKEPKVLVLEDYILD